MNESGCELQNAIYKDGTMPIHCVKSSKSTILDALHDDYL